MTNFYPCAIDNFETFSKQQIEDISNSISAAVEMAILEQSKALSTTKTDSKIKCQSQTDELQ